jgi:hypothetical protein
VLSKKRAAGREKPEPAAIASHIKRFRALRAGLHSSTNIRSLLVIGRRIIVPVCNRLMTEMLSFRCNRSARRAPRGRFSER